MQLPNKFRQVYVSDLERFRAQRPIIFPRTATKHPSGVGVTVIIRLGCYAGVVEVVLAV